MNRAEAPQQQKLRIRRAPLALCMWNVSFLFHSIVGCLVDFRLARSKESVWVITAGCGCDFEPGALQERMALDVIFLQGLVAHGQSMQEQEAVFCLLVL